MLKNLPEHIDALLLREFDFGAIDGLSDPLLDSCFCKTDRVEKFLQPKYNILTGAKGAGKSAVFRQLASRQLCLDGMHPRQCICMPLDEELQYEGLRVMLEQGLSTVHSDPSTRAYFLWEAYILFRLATIFSEQAGVPRDMKTMLADFTETIVGKLSKPTLFHVMTNFLPTVTFTLDGADQSVLTPTFRIEPSREVPASTQAAPEVRVIDLAKIKKAINNLARDRNLNVLILIDHLDDFVARHGYATQKQLLEGLIRCCKEYDRHANLHLRLFLRTDLYEKLDFSQMGGREKVDQRTVELEWRPQDIRQFLGDRLLYNLQSVYEMDSLSAEIDKNELRLRRESQGSHGGGFLKRWADMYDERYVHFKDHAYRMLISGFFPDRVPHFTERGTVGDVDLFEYFQSHFQLAGGESTPRHVLLFLQKLQTQTYEYYKANPDQSRLPNGGGFFRLFRPEDILRAYYELQQDLPQIFVGCITHKPWQDAMERFFAKKKKSRAFSYASLRNILKLPDPLETRSFIACMEHLRIVRRRDHTQPIEQSMFDLPVLLQYVFDPSSYRPATESRHY